MAAEVHLRHRCKIADGEVALGQPCDKGGLRNSNLMGHGLHGGVTHAVGTNHHAGGVAASTGICIGLLKVNRFHDSWITHR